MTQFQLILVCGKWTLRNGRKMFLVDSDRGARSTLADEKLTFQELMDMVIEDYDIERTLYDVNLSYMLPKEVLSCLPPDQPPVYVTNSRHLSTFLSQSNNVPVRLCVEIKEKGSPSSIGGATEVSQIRTPAAKGPPITHDENDEPVSEDSEEDSAEEVDEKIFDCCDDSDGIDSGDENFAAYGVTAAEVEEIEKTNKMCASTVYITDGNRQHQLRSFHVDSFKIRVGDIFDTRDQLEERLKMLTVIERFDYNVYKSTPNLLVVKCWVTGCSWKLRATPVDDWPRFHVRTYNSEHTCSVTERSSRTRQASAEILGIMYKDYVGGVGPSVLPAHVSDALNKRFNIKVDYWKAYKTLRHARDLVSGTPEEGYADLPAYLYMIKRANPGSHAMYSVDGQNRFKNLFLSFSASINGFEFLRKVVVVDGTFLQGRYKGTLLTATAQDGNFQIFPLAFGIVDTENDESWEWFFRQLSTVIPDDESLAIISDRHRSIGRAIGLVYPKASRGICTYHLYKNILLRYRGKEAFRLVKQAAYAFRLVDFQTAYNRIKELNPQLHEYLEKADVKLWTRVHFPGDRYNLLTTNMSETINKVLSPARNLTIVRLLEVIRALMTRWFACRRADAMKMKTQLTRGAEKLLEARVEYAKLLTVQEIDADQLQVTGPTSIHIVNLTDKKCSCRRFDLERIPCEHAIAASEIRKVSRISCCDPYYTKAYLVNSYSTPIMPRDFGEPIPADVLKTVKPPPVKPQPGRPKKRRLKTALEKALMNKKSRKENTCGFCHKTGHNRKTCNMR